MASGVVGFRGDCGGENGESDWAVRRARDARFCEQFHDVRLEDGDVLQAEALQRRDGVRRDADVVFGDAVRRRGVGVQRRGGDGNDGYRADLVLANLFVFGVRFESVLLSCGANMRLRRPFRVFRRLDASIHSVAERSRETPLVSFGDAEAIDAWVRGARLQGARVPRAFRHVRVGAATDGMEIARGGARHVSRVGFGRGSSGEARGRGRVVRGDKHGTIRGCDDDGVGVRRFRVRASRGVIFDESRADRRENVQMGRQDAVRVAVRGLAGPFNPTLWGDCTVK